MKIAAAVTLYNPTPEIINNAIRTSKFFSKFIIFDNSSDNTNYQNILKKIGNIIYLWDGKNYGLPKAFNKMLSIAMEHQIDYLCTLDQDSIISEASVKEIIKFITSEDMSNIGIVAPLPSRVKAKKNQKVQDVSWVICSGCFLNLQKFNEKNIRYDEAYFIDRFDVDICTQIRNQGLRIVRLNYVFMEHMCGDNGQHTIERHFYMFRNRFYYNEKYYSFPRNILISMLQSIKHIILITFGEKQKLSKIATVYYAIIDYKNGKLGEISAETKERIQQSVYRKF